MKAAYEAGGQSNRALSKKFGISETAIRKRAKKEGWGTGGLGALVTAREAATAKLAEAEIEILVDAIAALDREDLKAVRSALRALLRARAGR